MLRCARALDDVSLEVEPGEVFALVGENGAGKTALMNVVYGLYHPDRGRLRLFDKDAIVRSPADAIALAAGVLHQHFMRVLTLTLRDEREFLLAHARACDP